MNGVEASHAVHYMIGQGIVEPLTIVDTGVGWLGRWQESEVGHDVSTIFHYKPSVALDVGNDGLLGGVAINPLVSVPRATHLFSSDS